MKRQNQARRQYHKDKGGGMKRKNVVKGWNKGGKKSEGCGEMWQLISYMSTFTVNMLLQKLLNGEVKVVTLLIL